jgi:hypothetical protein
MGLHGVLTGIALPPSPLRDFVGTKVLEKYEVSILRKKRTSRKPRKNRGVM